MRIAIDGRYIQDHFPGIGRYTYNLVQALAETKNNKAMAADILDIDVSSLYKKMKQYGLNVENA